MSAQTDEALLTQREARVLLPFSDAWFEKKRRVGDGPPYKRMGRRILYPKAALLKYIEANTK